MAVNIPFPVIPQNEFVNQHVVPKCYMSEWSYNGGKSVYIYDKSKHFNKNMPTGSNWVIESKRTEKINAIDYYYDFTANSIYLPPEALTTIFGEFSLYHIYLNGNKLDTLEKLHKSYYNFSKWEIRSPDGCTLTQNEIDQVETYLKDSRYIYIEKAWNKIYENNWRVYIAEIEAKVRKTSVSNRSNVACISRSNIDLLIEYIAVYNWRSLQGNQEFNSIFESINNILTPQYPDMNDEIKKNLLLKYYNDFLENDNGMIRNVINIYKNNLHVTFCLTDATYPFITSNSPSYTCAGNMGKEMLVLIARPTMLVVLSKGNICEYSKKYLTRVEVDYYNRNAVAYGDLIIVPNKEFDISTFLID